ncbi:hypothetical protein OPV22_008598 [Ensete ventricosum]|uniref:EF-hand domain-containing protein n=1 Tax=Ensete ventricosum TaxID=4639 RepID=A0AAV8R6Z1_ENSVE|nr:hypothetical protein OPV22_008598 [Ensete ventricosum]
MVYTDVPSCHLKPRNPAEAHPLSVAYSIDADVHRLDERGRRVLRRKTLRVCFEEGTCKVEIVLSFRQLMANESAKQPLLSGLLDPPKYPHKNTTTKRKRFLRSKSAPSVDILLGPTEVGGTFPDSKLNSIYFRPSLKQVVLYLVIYLGAGAACFYLVKDQLSGKKTSGVLDAIYFSIVTMTTVGYGDMVPNSVTTKLLASVFVFTGMAIVGMLLSRAADYLVEKQEILLFKALHMRRKGGEAHMLKQIETNKVKYKFYTTTVILVFLVTIGTVFLWKVEKLDFVDAFYCVCSTITTLGYGDKSFSTGGGRAFAIFWIVTSTVCVAQFFLYLAELNAEHRQKLLAKWVLTRRMTIVDLEAADLDDDGVVGAAEFIIYKLKEMGKISEEDIALVMEEFEDLDIDQSGHSDKERKSFDEKFVKSDTDQLLELISAAHSLKLSPLVDLTSRTIARIIEGSSNDEIREIFRVPDDLTEEEKLEPLRNPTNNLYIRLLNQHLARKRKKLKEQKEVKNVELEKKQDV